LFNQFGLDSASDGATKLLGVRAVTLHVSALCINVHDHISATAAGNAKLTVSSTFQGHDSFWTGFTHDPSIKATAIGKFK
jgi:hypothetical protein